MEAWGIRTFENDEASDWIDAFAATPELGSLESALAPLEAREPAGELPDAELCSVALAAAEVVAAWCGRPAPELPPPVTAWLLGRTESVTAEILEHARGAVGAILERSELRELWQEAGEIDAWSGALEELSVRLGKLDE